MGIFFRTDRKCFKKTGYTFHNMVLTYGVGCTILFKRNDLVGKRVPNSKYKLPEEYIDELIEYIDELIEYIDELIEYIDELIEYIDVLIDYTDIKNKKLVI